MNIHFLVPALAAGLAISPQAKAQATGDGFMFRHPVGSIAIRGGFNIPVARSEIFSFTIEQLTHSRSDFNSWTGGADIALWLSPRLDLVLTGLYAGERTDTEFRNWIDNNNLPIRQYTTFERVPVVIGLRRYFKPRGRAIGRFAWVPERLTAYAGGGLGATWYRFRQQGDFVDFTTLRVFPDEFESKGLGLTAAAFAGGELALSQLFSLTSELRYSFASAGMSRDFVDFDPIDLSGFFFTIGMSVRLNRWPKWSELH